MTDIIFEAVALGVDAIISGAVITIITAVLALNTRLNMYVSQQETFATAATYYRQYSLYNNREISATEALSTFLYYDNDIDVILIDVSIENPAEPMYARIYEKEAPEGNMTFRSYPITVNPSDAAQCVISSDAGTIAVCTMTEEEISKALRNAYKSGTYTRSAANEVVYTDITVAVNSYGKYYARLLEDLAKYPADDTLYKGSVVTRIWIERIDTIE